MTPATLTQLQGVLKSIAALVLLCVSVSASAQERILSFHSDIEIATDASMTVAKTIRFRAEGVLIRRGLYREFPTQYRYPPRGVIFPHYEPPTGFSPAAARYIMQMHYDNKTLTAAIVSLAVKGGLLITQQGDTYTLLKRESDQALSLGEAALDAQLFPKSDSLVLENENHTLLSKARSAHARALSKEFKGPYFVRNAWYLGPSILAAFTKTIGSSFDSAISSAATAPGSRSSAGGGGFSGGGGGGGRGGGAGVDASVSRSGLIKSVFDF